MSKQGAKAGQGQRPFRLVATGGGTAGHVHPALAVVEAVRQAQPEAQILYLGSSGGMEERLVKAAGLPWKNVASGALRGRAPWTLLWNLAKMKLGYFQALGRLVRFRPDAVLATGGYGCVPTALAAWTLRIPVLVYLPDLRPGLAVRFLARIAQRVAITAPEAAAYLPAGKTVVTGYPVRPDLRAVPEAEARAGLGLPAEGPVILVVGGSRGAQTLNVAVEMALPSWLEIAWVVHSCGAEDYPEIARNRETLPAEMRNRYHPYPFLGQEMAWALSAADLIISRAGASVLGELPAFGLPAALVPYPYAGAHQQWNAAYLAKQGAAVVLSNSEAREGKLLPLAQELMADCARLAAMAERSRALAHPEAAGSIAQELLGLGGMA